MISVKVYTFVFDSLCAGISFVFFVSSSSSSSYFFAIMFCQHLFYMVCFWADKLLTQNEKFMQTQNLLHTWIRIVLHTWMYLFIMDVKMVNWLWLQHLEQETDVFSPHIYSYSDSLHNFYRYANVSRSVMSVYQTFCWHINSTIFIIPYLLKPKPNIACQLSRSPSIYNTYVYV